VHSNAPRRPFRVRQDTREGRRLPQDVLTLTSHTTDSKTRPTKPPQPPTRSAHHDAISLRQHGGQQAYADVEVLAANGFDPELAGAHRLGVDITSLLGSDAASALDAILTDAALARLANDMPTRVVDHHARLSALRAGVRS